MCWKCVITNVFIFGCMASKFMCLSFSTLHSSFYGESLMNLVTGFVQVMENLKSHEI